MSMRVEMATYEAFRRIADANHRSMASELRRLVEAHVAEYDDIADRAAA